MIVGYRQYFRKVEKTLIDELSKCKTEEEIVDILVKNGIECDEDYIRITDIGCEVFEFGKYYENAESINKKGRPLFFHNELQGRFDDYAPIVGGKELMLDAIEWQKNHIIKMYEDLLDNKLDEFDRYRHDGKTDEEIQYIKLKEHTKSHLNWWKPKHGNFTAINTSLTEDKICDSWLYEHTIFELVRIYKEFDDEKYYVLFIGW